MNRTRQVACMSYVESVSGPTHCFHVMTVKIKADLCLMSVSEIYLFKDTSGHQIKHQLNIWLQLLA